MKALVIGGAGFIGKSVVNQLKDEYEITVIDNLRYGDETYTDEPGITFKEKDLYLTALVNIGEISNDYDVIVNLACIHLKDSYVNPIRDLQVNTESVIPILEELKDKRDTFYVHISTGSVYQLTQRGEGSSQYAISKYATERYILLYVKQYGVKATIVRPFNVYGINGRGVINVFLQQALHKTPYTIHGEGDQRLRPTHVDDVAAIIKAVIDKRVSGEVIDAVGEESFTVSQIADGLDKAMSIKNKREYITAPSIYKLNPDTIPELGKRAKEVLGWKQPNSFKERIAQMVKDTTITKVSRKGKSEENVLPLTCEECWALVQDRYEQRTHKKKGTPSEWKQFVREMAKEFKEFVGIPGNVLDIGCGNGKYAGSTYESMDMEYINCANTIIGLDPARKSYETRFPVVRAFGEDIPLQDNFFDGVVIATSLDHIKTPKKVLYEAKRVLKENGQIYIWNAIFEEGQNNPWHLHTWTEKGLTDLIAEVFVLEHGVRFDYPWRDEEFGELFICAKKEVVKKNDQ